MGSFCVKGLRTSVSRGVEQVEMKTLKRLFACISMLSVILVAGSPNGATIIDSFNGPDIFVQQENPGNDVVIQQRDLDDVEGGIRFAVYRADSSRGRDRARGRTTERVRLHRTVLQPTSPAFCLGLPQPG